MRILVTGAKGFVGKNLCAALKNIRDNKDRRFPDLKIEEIFEYDLDSTPEQLDQWCAEADFVFNLAGVNRPQNQEEFMQGNFGFASTLLDTLKKHGNKCPIMLSSSQQASLTGRFGNSEYGRSKKAGEDLFLEYERDFLKQPPTNSPLSGESENPPLRGGKGGAPRVLIYRFPNLFGKWCRPNYNSAVATFCNAFANDLPYTVNDPSVELELLYIDDLVDEMIAGLQGKEHRCEFNGLEVIPTTNHTNQTNNSCNSSNSCSEKIGRYCYVPITHKITLGGIVDLLKQFTEQPKTLMIPEIPAGSFAKKLYSTYLSYLPYEKTAFDLKMNVDDRGSFTELVHTLNAGQVSINISKPGITKGQHWHNTKFEQFIVVKGHGLIQQRNLNASLLPTSPSRGGEAPSLTSPSRGGDNPYNTADPALYEELKEKAESMRKNPTEAESAMWEMLRGKNLEAKFRRQHIIGDYIVDFVCLDSQLVVEIDGGYHNDPEQKELDRQRTGFLQSKGFSVLRFTNEEVLANTEETLGIIKNALKYLPLEGGTEGGCWFVSGDKIEAVHMLPGYTHNIINLSETEDLVTVMYCNEVFNPNKPDTFFEPVK
jgi:UDP-2-acetamido-2,6-beta-L-arabino-hexul-4-ose reductase